MPSEVAQGHSILEGTIFASPAAEGYSADSSTAGTLIDVPNLDVPATVSVIPEQLLTDQQAIEIDDLLRNVAGAVKVNDDRRPDAFYLRGFMVDIARLSQGRLPRPDLHAARLRQRGPRGDAPGAGLGALRRRPALRLGQPDHRRIPGPGRCKT